MKELVISENTTTRRLDRLKKRRLLDLSLQYDPASMIGYVQFVILIDPIIEMYTKRMYAEF